MKQGFIYLIRNLVNNKVYIGQTDRTPHLRWINHRFKANNDVGAYLHRAMKKHGEDKFTIEVIETVSINALDDAEIKLIAHYESFTDRTKGYNLTAGGGGVRGRKRPPEEREAIRRFHTGRKRSPETH